MITSETIDKLLADLKTRDESIAWHTAESPLGRGNLNVEISSAAGRPVMLWIVEGATSARILVASYTFDDVDEEDISSFLTSVLTGGEMSNVLETKRSMTVTHGPSHWMSE